MNSRLLCRSAYAALLVSLSLLVACEQAFTTSPLSWLERDPDNMSKAQQIRYAEDALRSGSRSSARKAYDALSKNVDADDDAELNLLLADLAMNASGFSDALPDLLELALDGKLGDQTELENQLENKLGDLSYHYVGEALKQIEAVHDKGATASEQQYLEVGLALVMRAAHANDGDFNPGVGGDEWVEAEAFVDDAVNVRLTDPKYIDDLLDYF